MAYDRVGGTLKPGENASGGCQCSHFIVDQVMHECFSISTVSIALVMLRKENIYSTGFPLRKVYWMRRQCIFMFKSDLWDLTMLLNGLGNVQDFFFFFLLPQRSNYSWLRCLMHSLGRSECSSVLAKECAWQASGMCATVFSLTCFHQTWPLWWHGPQHGPLGMGWVMKLGMRTLGCLCINYGNRL